MSSGKKYIIVDEDGEMVGVTHGALHVATNEHMTTKTKEYTADGSGNIAADALITPSTGHKIAAQLIFMGTDGAAGVANLDFATSAIKIFRLYPTKNSQSTGAGMHLEGALNEAVTFSASGLGAGAKVFVIVVYTEDVV